MKSDSVPISMGTRVKQSSSTIQVMGRTLLSDSSIFSFSLSFM